MSEFGGQWTRQARAMLFAVAMLAIAAPAALANGGGGGSISPTPSGPQINPAQSYQEGLEALQAGDYRTAEKKFGEVLNVARKHPEANYYMGLAKIGRGKTKSSVRYFKRAVKERSNFIEAREQLALVSIELGDADDAAEQLAALQDIKAGCASQACGSAFETRLDQAIAKVAAALGVSPQSEDGAEEDASDAEEVSAAPGQTQRFSGLVQPWEKGADHYRSAVRLINQDRYEEAIVDLYASSAVIGPHPDIFNYLGYAHRKLGRFKAAKAYYAQALKLAPDHLGATEYLGELYLELGRVDKARDQLAKLNALCAFGCAEREDLARRIEIRESARHAGR